jgi:hypothetical protein
MQRRTYLSALVAGLVGGTAGCANVVRDDDTGRAAATTTARTGTATAATDPSLRPDERQLPVPESELNRSAARDAIPAIVDPAFGPDWSDVAYDIDSPDGSSFRYDPTLDPDDEVLGVVHDGRARAYPLPLLDWHEVVNDEFGEPLLATYCPVCRSGVVADRTVDGDALTFGVSGFLFRANLVLYDAETESLWSQLLATAIRGPHTGTELAVRPSTLTTWRAWREAHPDTDVLLPPPRSGTVVGEVRFNYDIDIYGRRRRVQERFPDYGPLGDLDWSDTRLRRRTVVLGVATEGGTRAYPRDRVRNDWPVNDTVGYLPVVVATGADDTPVAYERRIGGTRLRFTRDGDSLRAGGSRWDVLTGAAVDGPYDGTELRRAPGDGPLYWAAWLQFHPETTVWGLD